MANTPETPVLVRATVIMNIPDLDLDEQTKLYRLLKQITDEFGGTFNVNTQPQSTNPTL